MKKTLVFFALLLVILPASPMGEDGTSLALVYRNEVDRRLDVPQQEQARYAQLLGDALAGIWVPGMPSQYVLAVDRNPNIQAILLYWLESLDLSYRLHFIGASPVSTGKPGKFDHFITPLGVFVHTLDNRDFRAEGSHNSLGIRALGRKGMRAYDFGWTEGERGWGRGGKGQMRLLMHTTDPDYLEQYLGRAMSKGCIRIAETLNTFIDRYGLLDADYEQALAGGKKLWVMRPDRTPTLWPGRYLVIVDSGSTQRPEWSPEPPAIQVPENSNQLVCH